MFKLYLDPGHGGSDAGAVGNGIMEKDVALSIAVLIRDILESEYQDVSVRMSRTGDTFLSYHSAPRKQMHGVPIILCRSILILVAVQALKRLSIVVLENQSRPTKTTFMMKF